MKLKRNSFYLIVLLSLVTLNGCQSFHVANDNWQGKDKAQHFLFSMVASAGANAYADHQNYSYREGLVIGLSFSISLGVAKELCSGQLKLATVLEFSQYNRSDSLGVRPPLY